MTPTGSYWRRRIGKAGCGALPSPRAALPLMLCLLAAGCAGPEFVATTVKTIGEEKAAAPPAEDRAAPKPAGHYKVGEPYEIDGVWYYPKVDYDYDKTGIASWYGPAFHGRPTANGEIFDQEDLTAAHRTLPMPSMVRVFNLENGRALTLRVNDRGPFVHGRIIDISRRGAQLLGFEGKGTAKVRVQILESASRRAAGEGIRPARGPASQAGGPVPAARPRPPVTAAALSPLPGTDVSQSVAPTRPAAATGPGRVLPQRRPETGVVAGLPVRDTDIFVQAGAFRQPDNARQMRGRLAAIGTVRISTAVVAGRRVHRVRIGPLAGVADADRVLAAVIRRGFPGARIVVE